MTPIEALLTGIAVGAGLVLAAQFMAVLNQRISSLKDIQEGIEEILSRPATTGWTDEDEEDREPSLLTPREREQWKTPDDEPAIPMDPSNPPVPRTFNPDVNRDPRDYPICNCHSQRLTAGEQILWWPQPDGSVMILHPDYIHTVANSG